MSTPITQQYHTRAHPHKDASLLPCQAGLRSLPLFFSVEHVVELGVGQPDKGHGRPDRLIDPLTDRLIRTKKGGRKTEQHSSWMLVHNEQRDARTYRQNRPRRTPCRVTLTLHVRHPRQTLKHLSSWDHVIMSCHGNRSN